MNQSNHPEMSDEHGRRRVPHGSNVATEPVTRQEEEKATDHVAEQEPAQKKG
jgi:hypothetical protein